MLIFGKFVGMDDFALYFCTEWEILKSFTMLPFSWLETNVAENVFFLLLFVFGLACRLSS